jgi:hypothetical protein
MDPLASMTALADYWDIESDEKARVVCARLDWHANGPAAATTRKSSKD